MARYDHQLAEQQKLVDRFRFVSPAILVQGALSDIAGTGPDRYRHFLSQVDRFHAEWQSFFIPKVFQKLKLTESDYDALPRFAYVEEAAGAVASRIIVPLAVLSLGALIVGVLAMPALRRYPLNG
jgi:ABC-2 type transport system permease protein